MTLRKVRKSMHLGLIDSGKEAQTLKDSKG